MTMTENKKNSIPEKPDSTLSFSFVPVLYALLITLVPYGINKKFYPPYMFTMYTWFLKYTAATFVLIYISSLIRYRSTCLGQKGRARQYILSAADFIFSLFGYVYETVRSRFSAVASCLKKDRKNKTEAVEAETVNQCVTGQEEKRNIITGLKEYLPFTGIVGKFSYIGAHILIALYFFYRVVYIPSFKVTHRSSMDYLFISFFVLVTISSMVVYKWLEESDSRTGQTTAVTLLKILSAFSALTAICWSARVIIRWDLTYFLFWSCKITAAYLVILLFYNLAVTFINGTVTEKFDIAYLLSENDSDKETFIELLQKNTGLSLKSLWSLGYILDVLPYAVIFTVAMVFIFSSVYIVEPYQQAVVYRLGRITEASVKGAGLHFKYPWPVDKVEFYDVARIKTYQVGYESKRTSVDMLWTQEHEGGEYALLLGNGNELIAVNININYVIDDLYSYITECRNVEPYITALSYEVLMDRTITTTLDEFIQENRTRLAEELKVSINKRIKEAKLGISIKDVMIGAIHPPVEIASIYQGVVGAQNQKKTKVLKAEAAELESRSKAEKEAKSVVLRAEAARYRNIAEAKHDMEVYHSAYEGYKISPESYKLDRQLTAFEKIVKGRKVYVLTPGIGSDLSGIIINRGISENNIPPILDNVNKPLLDKVNKDVTSGEKNNEQKN